MRIRRIILFLLLATIAVVAGIWFRGRTTAAALQERNTALHAQQQRLSVLRAEIEHLREQIRAAAPPAKTSREIPAAQEARRAVDPAATPGFATGEWMPAAIWKNEGKSTPYSTITTLLWAAAGGDLAAVQGILEFNEISRAQARTWYETLPPQTRSLYATPEDLVASVTIKNIPQTSAQMTWFHQTDTDHAVVGVLLTAQASTVPDPAPVIEPSVNNAPPSLTRESGNRLAVLNLHRTAEGWRVVVPVEAIERMAKVLRVSRTEP